jgi:hypothetical protein
MCHADIAMKSAVMAGLKVVPIKSIPDGSLDLQDLKTKAEKHKENLAAFMVRLLAPCPFGGSNVWQRSHILPLSAYLKMAYRT